MAARLPIVRVAELALLFLLVISGSLIAARTMAGPIESPVHVHSPLNVESFFGLSAVLLLLMRARAAHEVTAPAPPAFTRTDALAMAAVTLLTAAVFWRSTSFYFLSDDFLILRHALAVHKSYRQVLTTGGGDGFYRPLTYVSLAWTVPWAGHDPQRWHWIGLAIHMLNACLVFLIARRIRIARLGAWFASAMFAVHGSRPETVVWITGRFDLLATFFVLLGLALFLRSEAPIYRLASIASMLLGLLCKESAYAFPLMLAVLVLSRPEPWRKRALTLAPFFLVAACMFLFRWTLVGGIGGYLTKEGHAQAFSLSVSSVSRTLALRLWAVLFFPIDWALEPGVILGLATLAYVAVLALALAKVQTERRALFLSFGLLLAAALPPLQQLLIGADLQKARLLYLPSVGFALLLAVVAARAKPALRWAFMLAVLAFNTAAVEHNLIAWERASQQTKAVCRAVAACTTGPADQVKIPGLPAILNGVYFFANGLPACIEMERTSMPPPSGQPCSFRWDEKTESLQSVPAGLP
jgi:hypothetical protein